MPSRSVVIHSRVQVSCVIEEGDPPFSIRWFRNGRPLQHQAPYAASPSAAASYGASSSPSTFPPLLTAAGLRVTDFNAYSSILTIDQVCRWAPCFSLCSLPLVRDLPFSYNKHSILSYDRLVTVMPNKLEIKMAIH